MNRRSLLKFIAEHCRHFSYLEIGCHKDGTFNELDLPVRVGVDPNRGGTVRMTSDEFFAINQQTFDLVFVDGLHLREQVLRDVENALRWLKPGGCIVLHDCLPSEEAHQLREPLRPGKAWTGDVWKAVVDLRQRPDLDIAVLDADWGQGVLFPRPNSDLLADPGELEWASFVADRDRLLRVVDEAGIRAFVNGEAVRPMWQRVAGVDQREPPADVPTGGSLTLDPSHLDLRGGSAGASPSREAGRPVVVFAHSGLAQFRFLHRYLNESGLATSYVLCSKNTWKQRRDEFSNLVPFEPYGGKLKVKGSYYYLNRVEKTHRRSLGILEAIETLQLQHRVDLLVGHVTGGNPALIADEVDFPVITYLEFASFRAHGWDAQYPPPDNMRLRDPNFEMLSWHSVLRSDHAIVPSAYARSQFPAELQSRISVLMEGFDPAQWEQTVAGEPDAHALGDSVVERPVPRTSRPVTDAIPALSPTNTAPVVGFAARDLSSAKGFEQFVRIANRIACQRPDVRFVVLGSEDLLYTYEDHFLDDRYGSNPRPSFRDYVLEKHKADRWRFTFPGLLPYKEYGQAIHAIDLFLYPLQFGSANWGLYELLGRGRIVIGSNRCFVPEAITDGVNGFLCDYDDIDAWVSRAVTILDDPTAHRRLGEAARQMARQYSIENVAGRFLKIADQVCAARQATGQR